MEEYGHRLLALAEEEEEEVEVEDTTVPGPAPATTPPRQAPRTVPWKKKQKLTASQVVVPPPARALARLAPRPPLPSPALAAVVALPPHTGPVPEPPPRPPRGQAPGAAGPGYPRPLHRAAGPPLKGGPLREYPGGLPRGAWGGRRAPDLLGPV
ncbi:hypothetical protein BJX66DRAFT_131915 [Aspergillus keveii]|uniref:Uncharacterized protein n=1 Tax=Aspergillus keveii TaxID=714993 RepID=A0ABR4FJB7_9EURO